MRFSSRGSGLILAVIGGAVVMGVLRNCAQTLKMEPGATVRSYVDTWSLARQVDRKQSRSQCSDLRARYCWQGLPAEAAGATAVPADGRRNRTRDELANGLSLEETVQALNIRRNTARTRV